MQATAQDNQVALINNSIELFRSAPEILQANQERTRKAVAVGNSILDQWKEAWAADDPETKMTLLAAADERSNKFLVNSATALKEEKEARAAITQMMDEFKKMFTSAESDIDRTKAGTVTSKVQENRDSYVKEVARIQDERRREAERKAAKEKEAIDLKATIETQLSAYFNDYLLAKKQKLTALFNGLQLRNFADDAYQIKLYVPEYKRTHFDAFQARTFPKYHNAEEIQSLTGEVTAAGYNAFAARYAEEMAALRDDLADKIPGKHQELKEQYQREQEALAEKKRQEEAEAERQRQIAMANAAEKKRLEAEAAEARRVEAERLETLKKEQEAAAEQQRKREAEESARMAEEAAAAQRKAEIDAEAKKQAEQTMVMFDQEASLADLTATPEARQGYEIEVLHAAGYVQIFQLWFEHEGKKLAIEKIGGTKMDQMKAWAEKHAHKTGEKIESKFLRYAESFKAVNRKAVK